MNHDLLQLASEAKRELACIQHRKAEEFDELAALQDELCQLGEKISRITKRLCELGGEEICCDKSLLDLHCLKLGVSVAEIMSKCRRHEIVRRRWVVMRSLSDMGWNINRIARVLKLDHAAVAYGLRQLTKEKELTK